MNVIRFWFTVKEFFFFFLGFSQTWFPKEGKNKESNSTWLRQTSLKFIFRQSFHKRQAVLNGFSKSETLKKAAVKKVGFQFFKFRILSIFNAFGSASSGVRFYSITLGFWWICFKTNRRGCDWTGRDFRKAAVKFRKRAEKKNSALPAESHKSFSSSCTAYDSSPPTPFHIRVPPINQVCLFFFLITNSIKFWKFVLTQQNMQKK